MHNINKKEVYKYILCIIFLIYLPLTIFMTGNISNAFSYNGDLKGVVENIYQFHTGIIAGDWVYALGGTTYGYGAAMFIFLGIITFPIHLISNNEQYVLIVVRSFSLITLILSFIMMKSVFSKIMQINMKNINIKKINLFSSITFIIISLFPATALLITRIHPEIFQMFIFLSAFNFLLKFNETKEKKFYILSSILFGIMIGTKISGIIFLCLPLLFIILENLDNKKETIKQILVFITITILMALFSAIPSILFDFKNSIINFNNELSYFSQTLKSMSISEFDYYLKLNSTKEVIKAWIIHIFNHGYVNVIGMIMILANIIYNSIIEIKEKIRVKINFIVLILLILNASYYIFFVTRVSTYYYYLPVCMVVACFIYNMILNEGLLDGKNHKKIKVILLLCLVIIYIPSILHTKAIYTEQVKNKFRLEDLTYRYTGLRNFISSKKYPEKSILLPTDINLNMSSRELNWFPYKSSLIDRNNVYTKENSFVENLQYYWTLEDIIKSNPKLVYNMDIVVIDKIQERNYNKYEKELIKNNMYEIYEDNYVLVYSKNQKTVENENINELISNNLKDKYQGAHIAFKENGWNSTGCEFYPAINLTSKSGVLIKFNYIKGDFENLRFVVNGYCESINENCWDYRIDKHEVKQGYNEIYIPKEKFIVQSGDINWNYVTSINFGADIISETYIDNLIIEIK